MKRILSLLIAALIVVLTASISVPSFAADGDELVLTMTNAAGVQNDEITVELNIESNPGFSYLVFLLYYDADTFILRDNTVSDEFHEVLDIWKSKDNVGADELTGPVSTRILSQMRDYNISANDKNFKIVVYEPYEFEDVSLTGNIATFTFQIMGIADDGDYTIGIMPSYEDIINIDSEELSVKWTNSTVRVGSGEPPVETQKELTYEDTVDPSEITEDPYESPSNVTESADSTETDKEPAGSESAETGDVATDTEKITDVEVETDPSSEKEVEVLGNKIPVLYIVIGALVILVIAAAILTAVFVRAKKKKQ